MSFQLAPFINTLGTAQLVAVSKFQSVAAIEGLYAQGQRNFGESRAQELLDKVNILPNDIQWHFIGHLQTNKVKQVLPYLSYIHSIDSPKILTEVELQARILDKKIKVLLEIKIGEEDTKYGLTIADAHQICREILPTLKKVEIVGVMGMASFTENEAQITAEFNGLHSFFQDLKQAYFGTQSSFCEISMGMSSDYKIAIASGSTMLRIGSLLFGDRN